MLTPTQIQFLREELQTAKNPLFLYDDDGDGLASFLLLYRINRVGKGIRITTTKQLDVQLAKKVNELQSDKIFILDIPLVDQEFIDLVHRPVFWLDHHEPQKVNNAHYFNPQINAPGVYIPTTRMAYQISGNPNDLWIAVAGCLGDWYMPDFIDEFIEKYPEYVQKKGDLTTLIYENPAGKLVKLFFFLQKGPHPEVRKSIKVLSRINSPDEIFKQESVAGKFLYRHFERINRKYEEILQQAKKKVTSGKLLVFLYPYPQWSFTANLANELKSLYPKKAVIIAREKSGEIKCSIRWEQAAVALETALVGINGRGGGHPSACGAVIKEKDWERFLNNFKEEMKRLEK